MLRLRVLGLVFTLRSVWCPSAWILLKVDSLSVGCSFSVISVNGWHELFEPHSYRCNIDLIDLMSYHCHLSPPPNTTPTHQCSHSWSLAISCCPCLPLLPAFQALERDAVKNHWQRTLHTPGVCTDALIPFLPRHVATVRGKLAESAPKAGDVVRGVLVQQAGQAADMQLLHPDELSKFTKLAQGECVGGGERKGGVE